MKAVILAAGKGTRMRELTQAMPKPMLAVRGKPILEHIVGGIAAAGIHEFCIITGWRAEVIEDHFGTGEQFGVSVEYVRQEVQDGTGKAPELAREFVCNSPFILTYGDILVESSAYASMVESYQSGDFQGAIAVTAGQDVRKGGINLFDAGFCLEQVVEKPSDEELASLRLSGKIVEDQPVWYNAGIYLFEPNLFECTALLEKSPRGEYELTDAINGLLARNRRLIGVKIADGWADVRDPEVLKSLK